MQHVVIDHPRTLHLLAAAAHRHFHKFHSQQYRNDLQALVCDLRLPEHVRFANQYLVNRELVEYLETTDIDLASDSDRNPIRLDTLGLRLAPAGRLSPRPTSRRPRHWSRDAACPRSFGAPSDHGKGSSPVGCSRVPS